MQSKLLEIKLNPGSKNRVLELIDTMKNNIELPKYEMTQKGYYWDSVFFDIKAGQELLYMVIKSEDFSKIMIDESELKPTPFRLFYEKFRSECWAPEMYNDIEALICFNQCLDFN
ncbi:MAG: hypothetical protein KUG78_04050 [Kangiellaceae bacterium]|nr:hypothetical protein [Kangiellaceae bacterium]